MEDLFYNVTTRRKVLRSGADEFSRVADVVTKYAVHNAGVALTLKRHGEHSLAVRTQRGASVRDNVATLYGAALARELVEVVSKAGGGVCEFEAIVSNVNYTAAKKFHFLVSRERSKTLFKTIPFLCSFLRIHLAARTYQHFKSFNDLEDLPS